jgi:hypothetical protein
MDEFASRRYPVQEHMRFQHRTWLIERIGWFVLAFIVLLALLGLFGSGFLSKRASSVHFPFRSVAEQRAPAAT